MAKKGDVRGVITLRCNECRRYSYTSMKNRRNDPGRLELNKFCPKCRSVRAFRETR